jgi:integrin beta 8
MTSVIYAVHSQRAEALECPVADHVKIATGYSLLHLQDEGRTVGQNLGAMGSCLTKFDPQPMIFCGANEVCTWGSRTVSSYWLTTNQRDQDRTRQNDPDAQEKPMSIVSNAEDLLSHISRCTVCMSKGAVIAVHSQSTNVPACPTLPRNSYGQWVSLWTGYSFLMHAIGPAGQGQQLDSPGSCLQRYSRSPYIECDADGYCHYWSDYMMYWLYPSDVTFPNNTVKRTDVSGRIGRCRVCSYQPMPLDQLKKRR